MSKPFSEFDFNDKLKQAINDVGYVDATPIQAETIPHILEKKDIIAKAQTGSGKTAAFSLPALELLSQDKENTILVITPTRELAMQVCHEMKLFSKHLKIEPALIYGGESFEKQIQRVKKDSRVIVGTPGRLLDFFSSKKHLKNFKPKLVVLDEADEMLNMGFLEDIQSIFSHLPEEKQTLLFSATLPSQIKKVCKQILTDPVTVDQSKKDEHNADIHQVYHLVAHRERTPALVRILQYHMPDKAIVFCNTKREVDEVYSELVQVGFSTLCLHGDMSQSDRKKSIDRFRNSKKSLLVATDVAGRGINVTDISHVFNYELPYSPECYTHRIGRTGRMGNKGVAITLLTQKQIPVLRRFVKTKASNIDFSDLPTVDEIKYRQQIKFTENLGEETIHVEAENILNDLKKSHKLEEISLRLISRYFRKEAPVKVVKLTEVSELDVFSAKKKRRGGGRSKFDSKGPRRRSSRRDRR